MYPGATAPSEKATAPAQEVHITDQLDASLDWSTYETTGIQIGDLSVAIPDGTQTFSETVSAVVKLKAGQVEYRVDRFGIIHAALGKLSFSTEQTIENIRTYLDAVIKAKPAAVKGIYVRSISISSTMGPGVKVTYAGVG